MKKQKITGFTLISLIIVVVLMSAVVFYILDPKNKLFDTENSQAKKIQTYANGIIYSDEKLGGVRIESVKYSELGKVAMFVISAGTVEDDVIIDQFDVINDLDYVRDVQIVFKSNIGEETKEKVAN